MSNLATRTYCPRTGSIPQLAISYFQKNLSAKLTTAEAIAMFDTTNIAKVLELAIEAGFIARSNGYYKAGDDIDQAPDYGSVAKADATIKAAATAPGAAHNPFASAAHHQRQATARKGRRIGAVDFTAFKVEDGIPMAGGRGRGTEKWAPLLDKLTKAGQSVVIDPNMKTAIYAASKARQAKGVGKYKAGADLQGNTRPWRTE